MTPISHKERWIILICALGIVFVHLYNLGLMPLMADEKTRAAVSLEMILSGNYLVPTIWGEYYYWKPPLYNWILSGFFLVFDSYSEFVLRLPSVIPLFFYGVAIWFVSRKHIGSRAGAIAAFAFILSGRLLTRDSMLGHIDILFSLVTFMGFFAIYHFHRQKAWWKLFLLSYALAGIGVLMKGLPSLLFQSFTLGAWLLYQRDWKKLFSIQHIVGILLLVLIVGGYFLAYSQYNGLETYFNALYGQAAQRTVVEKSWYDGILNFVSFPFENLMHLAPTSLLILFAFRKGQIRRWLKSDFTAFVLLTLAVNVIPYWLSPGYYPRYLFMLYPLFFLLIADAFVQNADSQNVRNKVFNGVLLVILIALLAGSIYSFVAPELEVLNNSAIWSVLLVLFSLAVIVFWFRMSEHRVYALFFALLIFRLAFDVFVIPFRAQEENSLPVFQKANALRIAELTFDKEVHLYSGTPAFRNLAFYLGAEKQQIIRIKDVMQPDTYYLSHEKYLKDLPPTYSVQQYEGFNGQSIHVVILQE